MAVAVTQLTDVAMPMPLPRERLFPGVADDEWQRCRTTHPEAFTADGGWMARVSAYLVRGPRRTILVDTGIGPATTAFARSVGAEGALPAELARLGIEPGAIDIVLLTHLHADHLGWNVSRRDGTPTFPNARYIAHAADWAMCEARLRSGSGQAAHIHENLLPLYAMGRLELVHEAPVLDEGVATLHTPGHTPGHLAVRAGDAWMLGDVLAHPVQIADPSQPYGFDADPDRAAHTRRLVLDELVATGDVASACHLPEGFGRVTWKDGRREWCRTAPRP